jgi:hypothetical protein
MIKPEQIKSFIETRPFRRFYLETSGGNYLVVQTPDHIKMPPPAFDLIIIFGEDGLVHHIDKNTVLNAAVVGPTPKSQDSEIK